MLPKEIQWLFEHLNINYEIIKHRPTDSLIDAAVELDIDPSRVAISSLVKDSKGTLMLVYPANAQLDLPVLNEKLSRRFQLIPEEQIKMEYPTYFDDRCAPISILYKLSAEVHVTFTYSKYVYFAINQQEFCRVSGEGFSSLQGQAMYDDFFALLPEKTSENSNSTGVESGRRHQILDKLKNLNSLPPMPTIAQRLLQLSSNPYAGARDLAVVIEQDPSLSAQIIRYASSPLYGFTGQLNSIQDVIARVLGFDLVMDMALGVSVGKMFKNPKDGRLGLNEFWRHATYNAVLCQKLTKAIKGKLKPRPGMAYLAGLLHNFGLLLLGHLFPKDFQLLNKAATQYPETSIIELEHTMIGTTHMEIGVWLMQAWNMPDEIVISLREHHNEHYHDIHSVYPNIIMLANRMLADVEIGDEISTELPQSILNSLLIDKDEATQIFEEVMGIGQGLEYMALQMAA